jgi:hypothetical protein
MGMVARMSTLPPRSGRDGGGGGTAAAGGAVKGKANSDEAPTDSHWSPLARLHSLGLGRFPGRIVRVATTPRLAPGRAVDYAPQRRLMDVHTFVSDERQYAGMREAFQAAGFESVASFHRLSDAETEPYAAINQLAAAAGAPYAVLCHQDVRPSLGAGAERLLDLLAALDRLDPGWTVAGDAGVLRSLAVARRVSDRFGGMSSHLLPARVMSLDENLLVLNRRNGPRCSPELSGFHFYGTDVCLNAITDGGSAYVVDFPVTHGDLGPPKDYGVAYVRARDAFLTLWSTRRHPGYIGTTTEVLTVGHPGLLRNLLDEPPLRNWVLADRDRSSRSWLAHRWLEGR